MKQSIIWDWNGTLLNDADYCVECMNIVLANHNLPSITLEIYKDKFTFPVKDYYAAIGFDFSKVNFEEPAMEFIHHYYSGIDKVSLHHGVSHTLQFFREKGIQQFSLSAMEHQKLISSLGSKGIIKYFEGIKGIDDHYANGKVEMGKQLINEYKIEPESTIMVGDTVHDFEVAKELGIDCVLITGGHQSKERLRAVTQNIVDFSDLPEYIS